MKSGSLGTRLLTYRSSLWSLPPSLPFTHSFSPSLPTSFHSLSPSLPLSIPLSLPPCLPAELCVPMNSAQFVISVSEQLARNEPHLTLEFLSELVVGFQQYSPALKQLCLAYMSPWIPNLSKFAARTEGITEQEKVMKLIDLFVSLTISEEEVGC